MKFYRNAALASVCIILGIMVAWQFQSVDRNKKVAGLQNKRLDELRDELITEKKKNDDLRKRSEELIQKKEEYEAARGSFDKTSESLKTELERVKILAGLVPVKGRGIVITLEGNEFSSVEDSDILNILNELRASDVQAISVNDERIVAMSEVRVAGRYIMINGRQMISPFVIKAIADPDKVERSLKIVNGIIDRLKAYQLKVNMERSDNVLIPKAHDDGTILKTDLLAPVKN